MSRKAADYTDVQTDKYGFIFWAISVFIRASAPWYPWHLFNNVVYQNGSFLPQYTAPSNGDQVALFYCEGGLDHSESSMLVSAGFESHRPVNS